MPRRIPKVGCPAKDFYNAAGTNVALRAEAVPAEVRLGEWLTYTLTITNLLNAAEVEKPSLKKLPEFAPFQIDEEAELDPKMNSAHPDQRIFVYRLRPSSLDATLIPEIAFHYYDPRIREPETRPQLAFPKRYANAVPITIKPPPEKPRPAVIPLTVPSFAETLPEEVGSTSFSSRKIPEWCWLIAFIVPPVLAILWALVWSRVYPDEAKRARLRRVKIVRQTLASLTAAQRDPTDDPAGTIASLFIHYLRERHQLPSHASTPHDVTVHLRSLATMTELLRSIERFLEECDAARFAPQSLPTTDLYLEAERLVLALEESA